MLIIWPWLFTSVSFQLSVAASAGMVWGTRKIFNLEFEIINEKAKTKNVIQNVFGVVGGDLRATLAATLATLPISLVTFGQVAWIAPVVNVMVLWLVPPMMVLGGLLAILGLIVPWLGQILAVFTWPLLWGFVAVITWFGNLPFGLVEFYRVPWIVGIGWWVILAAWWSRRK
jgi:competence protein ComEC